MSETGFSIEFDLTTQCIRCGRERDPGEGAKRLLSSEGADGDALIVESRESCDCGERRIKVRWTLGAEAT